MEDDVVVRRKRIFKENDDEDEQIILESDNDESSDKYIKASSIILALLSILLFISLISYSRNDESIALTPISEIFGIFWGDEAAMFKAETARNWLGIIGSLISYHLYNSLFGISIIALPYFMILISKDLFLKGEIEKSTFKKSMLFLLFSLLISSLFGSFRESGIIESIPKEFAGNIGLFISNISVSFIGGFGSVLVYLTTIGILSYFIFDIHIPKLSFIDDIKDSIPSIPTMKNTNSKEQGTKNKEEVEDKSKKTKVVEEEVQISSSEDQNEDHVEDSYNNEIEEKRPDIEIRKEVPAKKVSITLNKSKDAVSSFEENYGDVELNRVGSKENETNEIEINEEDTKPIENQEDSSTDNTIKNELASEINDILGEESEEITNEIGKLEADSEFLTDNNEVDNLVVSNEEKIVDDQIDETKLVLDVEVNEEPEEVIESPLSTLIHEEKINFKFPKFDLLNPPAITKEVADDELKENGKILQEKLETFKIHIENLQVTPGPVVTQYAFTPAAGIKISRIENLADDLAMALKARGIRIIAPIPGKGSVGVEIPNANPSLVTFSSVIKTKKFQEAKSKMHLPVAMGKTISGETVVEDLSKMPHLLVAGATGAGKSVGVNTMINSLLYAKHPNELKFVIIDPKKVELQQYRALKDHYLATSPDIRSTIVTEPTDATALLKSTVIEMENRYEILSSVGQRNIADYNEKVEEGKYANKKDMVHRKMPYIVCVIDEYADLILTAGKEVEEPIVRLAQMARAVGIHLILATQRPSVDVITGIIKANFPARIAYRVASKIDSRTILDVQGAEKLLGNGDMLFFPAGRPKPERIQSPFISTDEVDAVCDFIGDQRGYSSSYVLPSSQEKKEGGDYAVEDRDPLFEDAARLIVSSQQGSVSMLQRRLKIGYARAGRIVDQLEDAGVVGSFDGSKARKVLLESEADLEYIL